MTGPTTHATAGGVLAVVTTSALDALGPSAVVALSFGALGGATRWLAARETAHGQKWYKGLWAVPLGASFALGMISIAAPFLAFYAGGAEPDEWFRTVLSSPEARHGISYLLGLFASEIMSRFSRDISGGK